MLSLFFNAKRYSASSLSIMFWLFTGVIALMGYLFTEYLVSQQKERVSASAEISAKGLSSVVNGRLDYHRLMLQSIAEHHSDRLYTLSKGGGYPFDLAEISNEIDTIFPDAIQFSVINSAGKPVIGSPGFLMGGACQADIRHHVMENNLLPAQLKVHRFSDGSMHYDMIHLLTRGKERAALFISFTIQPFQSLLSGFSRSEIDFLLVNGRDKLTLLVSGNGVYSPDEVLPVAGMGKLLNMTEIAGSDWKIIAVSKPGLFTDYANKIRLTAVILWILFNLFWFILFTALKNVDAVRKKLKEDSVQDALFNFGPTVLFQKQPDGFMNIQYVSPNVNVLIGVSVESILKDQAYSKLVFEEDFNDVQILMMAGIERKQDDIVFEYRLKDSQGGFCWVSDSTHIVYDENGEAIRLESYVTSIQHQKNAQADAIALIEQAPDAMVVTDYDGKVLRINQAFESLFEYDRKELLGRSIELCIDEDSRGLFETFKDGYISSGDNGNIILGRDKPVLAMTRSAKRLQVEVSLSRMNSVSGISMVHTIRDISARLEVQNQLEQARDNAEKLAKARSRFVATMSHEIRTPLNGILGMSHLLMGCDLNKRQSEYLEAIDYSGQSLLKIVNGILDFAKLDEGAVALQLEPINLESVIEASLKMLKTQADEKQVTLHYHGLLDTSAMVLGDSGKIQQIMVNLVGNAIKFSEKTRVDVFLKAQQRSAIEKGTTVFMIEVEDYGLGIDETMLDSLFDSFTQADESTTRAYGGTGLGLAITKQLTELMGGELSVNSALGEGSIFRVEIPLKRVNNMNTSFLDEPVEPMPKIGQNGSLSDKSDKGVSGDLLGKSILLVEDNEINQTVILSFLEQLGGQVDVAVNGIEGLSFWRSHGQKYDLILMDCQMPVMDGYEACQIIRAEEKISEAVSPIPIIAMTANAMHEDKNRCFAVGMNDFISKPISVEHFNQVIIHWAEGSKEESGESR